MFTLLTERTGIYGRTALAIASVSALLLFTCFSAGCGMPNLDPPECSAARTAVREFYSFHFAHEMGFSANALKQRERFLTPRLMAQLGESPEGVDPFTTGDADFPKAFRAGECRVNSPDRTSFDVLFFWKDDVRSEQRKITVDVVRSEDRWLIENIVRK